MEITSASWTETDPSSDQGVVAFAYKVVTALVLWIPSAGSTPEAILADNFALLQSTQPDLTFVPISEGDITVSTETGRFGGFGATDAEGVAANGGLIGAWVCSGPGTAYGLTTTGADATTDARHATTDARHATTDARHTAAGRHRPQTGGPAPEFTWDRPAAGSTWDRPAAGSTWDRPAASSTWDGPAPG